MHEGKMVGRHGHTGGRPPTHQGMPEATRAGRGRQQIVPHSPQKERAEHLDLRRQPPEPGGTAFCWRPPSLRSSVLAAPASQYRLPSSSVLRSHVPISLPEGLLGSTFHRHLHLHSFAPSLLALCLDSHHLSLEPPGFYLDPLYTPFSTE